MRDCESVRRLATLVGLAVLVFATGTVMSADNDADLATGAKTRPAAATPSTISSPTSSTPSSTQNDVGVLAFDPAIDLDRTSVYICSGPPVAAEARPPVETP